MASCAVVCGAIYACTIVASDIESAFTQRQRPARRCIWSVVERLVQELATRSSLSTENRDALERRLASLSPGKPIVAFTLWKGDSIVFSTKQKNADSRSPPGNLRHRMLRGEVVAKIAHGGAEAAQAAIVPLLEILAPIRQTGRIVSSRSPLRDLGAGAGAGNTRCPVRELRHHRQRCLYARACALQSDRPPAKAHRELALQGSADAHFRKRLCRANGRVFELNQRNMRRIGRDLHAGPLQLAALALLKVDLLSQPADEPSSIASDRASDIVAMRKALTQCLHQIRAVSASLAPSELHDLSLPETIRTAICLHDLRTARPVTCDLRDLPTGAPNTLKGCAYQFVSYGLSKASQQSARCSEVHARATEQDNLEIELRCEMERSKTGGLANRGCRTSARAAAYRGIGWKPAGQTLRPSSICGITARFGLARVGAQRAVPASAA